MNSLNARQALVDSGASVTPCEHGPSSAMPTEVFGWDARYCECFTCGHRWTEVRGMPAEGSLIDPDPHL